MSIEDFIESGKGLPSADLPRVTITDLIQDIINATGATYTQIGEIIHLQGTQVGRLARGNSVKINDDSLLLLAENFNVPVERVIFANAYSSLVKNIPDIKERLDKMDSENAADQEIKIRPGSIIAYDFLRLNEMHLWHDVSSNKEHKELIHNVSRHKLIRMGAYAVTDRDDCFFVKHLGPHMVSEKMGSKSIPDDAIIEVQLMPENGFRDGDIVLVQIELEWATSYIYHRHSTRGVEHEEFQPININHPSRILTARKKIDRPLSEQRVIFGRVNKIVYSNLLQ